MQDFWSFLYEEVTFCKRRFRAAVSVSGQFMATLLLAQLKVSWTALLALAYFTYLLVGAAIFQILEREAECNNRYHFQLEKLHFLANYTCLDGPALEQFVQCLARCSLGKCLIIHWDEWRRGWSQSLLFLVIPPLMFSYVEGWTFGEGFYFAFITLSTIGFGDYVVGTDPDKEYISLYRSLAGIWIILALAWLALVFNMGARIMEYFVALTHPGFKRQQEEDERSTQGSCHPIESARFCICLELSKF
uniref:Potassium two pore domain channel subfamily K member 16 n=1 Tax=Neogobius melanostomus TaxID=47308 RepID=A0A8C6WZP3_9GOBI